MAPNLRCGARYRGPHRRFGAVGHPGPHGEGCQRCLRASRRERAERPASCAATQARTQASGGSEVRVALGGVIERASPSGEAEVPASSHSSSRTRGWAASRMRWRHWACWSWPQSSATPCSVTMALCWKRDGLVDERHDGRHVGLGVPRAQRDERLAAGGVQRADDEVGLAAEPGVDPRVDPRGVGLAEEVDLESGVDRGHRPLLGDQAGVVGRLGAHHPDPRGCRRPSRRAPASRTGTTR